MHACIALPTQCVARHLSVGICLQVGASRHSSPDSVLPAEAAGAQLTHMAADDMACSGAAPSSAPLPALDAVHIPPIIKLLNNSFVCSTLWLQCGLASFGFL